MILIQCVQCIIYYIMCVSVFNIFLTDDEHVKVNGIDEDDFKDDGDELMKFLYICHV